MKASIFLSILGMVLLTACRKSHTCTCTTKDSDGNVISVVDDKQFEATKKEAKQTCERSGKNGEYFTECELKE